ncbi:MAG TPA: helix-turn-helix domain-containing protein [Chloroflexia bacterium]|nr:helix-turn-helix domain-containing protein [Chloroflexia bacterium]
MEVDHQTAGPTAPHTTADASVFGRWLRRQRKERDLTQEELAERIRCSVWSIQKIEVGNRRPSKQVAELLADYFEIASERRSAFLHFARGHSDRWEAIAGEQPPQIARGASIAPYQRPGTRPGNLPTPLTSFVGRDSELPRIHDLMRTSGARLLTLTGPPGTGKTRLAVQAAVELLADFPDGIFFVNLAPISSPELVVSEIAQSLGVSVSGSGSGGASLFDTVISYLESRDLLLILDNFEQIVEAGPQIGRLLERTARLKVMATSRIPLNIRGEKTLALPPLQVPDLEHLPSLDRLGKFEAIELFVQRASDVRSDFDLTSRNTSAVAHICSRLDGLPLAIELAAARVKILSPQAILNRLESRFQLLTVGAQDLPSRQRTLRSAIEWSYDLLDEGEKKLFRRMAVFNGGRTLDALEAVCSYDGQIGIGVLDGVESLVSKSLLQ